MTINLITIIKKRYKQGTTMILVVKTHVRKHMLDLLCTCYVPIAWLNAGVAGSERPEHEYMIMRSGNWG